MKGRVRRMVRDLRGRTDREFVRMVRGQLDITVRGCELISLMNTGALTSARAREEMRSIEHAGDEQRRELVDEISRALTTPIDREDLFRLSRSIDDVLDNLRDFVREADLFDLGRTTRFDATVAAMTHCLRQLDAAVANLADEPRAVAEGVRAAKKAGNEVRRTYQDEVARLLDGELSVATLKVRELLRRLDIAGLRLGEAADVLADAVMKRSH